MRLDGCGDGRTHYICIENLRSLLLPGSHVVSAEISPVRNVLSDDNIAFGNPQLNGDEGVGVFELFDFAHRPRISLFAGRST